MGISKNVFKLKIELFLIILISIFFFNYCFNYRKPPNVEGNCVVSKSKLKKIINYYYKRYKYTKVKGWDCSFFVKTVFNKVNIHLPRTSKEQFKCGISISKNHLRFGDLVFFKIGRARPGHVGIYLKNYKFIHISSSRGLVIDDLNNKYFKKRFMEGKRIICKFKK